MLTNPRALLTRVLVTGLQVAFDAAREALYISGLALPYDQDAPSHLLQQDPRLLIARSVPRQLWDPILEPGFGCPRETTPIVLVPEAPVNENRRSMPRKNEIRCAGKVPAIKPEAESHRMDEPPNNHLWLRIHLANTPHMGAAFLGA